MRPTLAQRATPQPWRNRPDPVSYRSPYGPKGKIPSHIYGIDSSRLIKYGGIAAFWGTVAGAGALMFFSEVPKVRKDIMQKLPIIGGLFVKEVPPSDNPF